VVLAITIVVKLCASVVHALKNHARSEREKLIVRKKYGTADHKINKLVNCVVTWLGLSVHTSQSNYEVATTIIFTKGFVSKNAVNKRIKHHWYTGRDMQVCIDAACEGTCMKYSERIELLMTSAVVVRGWQLCVGCEATRQPRQLTGLSVATSLEPSKDNIEAYTMLNLNRYQHIYTTKHLPQINWAYRVAQKILHTFCMLYNFIKYWPIFSVVLFPESGEYL